MNKLIYNFGAGPGMLPPEILKEAQAELLNWQNLSISILEAGHRSSPFIALMEELEALLRSLLQIPASYHVLFLGGPTRINFAMVPLNFLKPGMQAGFWITGIWSASAYKEAKKLKNAYCIATNEPGGYCDIPKKDTWQIKENSGYLYYTANETINGLRFNPLDHTEIKSFPIISDLTSCLLTEPINIKDYGMIIAGAQKNIANAGLTIAIINETLVSEKLDSNIPTMLDYGEHIRAKSMYATLPTFNCYLALKMLTWIKNQGGVDALYKINLQKAALLYNFIDKSDFYVCRVAKNARSYVNVCFSLTNPFLEDLFLKQAEENGLMSLQGHRMTGGIRASIYNAMPLVGVQRLIEFMNFFAEKNNGKL